MATAEIKMKRIKRENAAEFKILKEIVTPEVLHAHVPRLATVAEARVEHKNMMNTIQALGASGATGFDPKRNIQYVANIDQSIWRLALNLFAKIDPTTGDPMDDGLLYRTDTDGHVKLDRDFFYTLLDIFTEAGYDVDMRGKVKLTC